MTSNPLILHSGLFFAPIGAEPDLCVYLLDHEKWTHLHVRLIFIQCSVLWQSGDFVWPSSCSSSVAAGFNGQTECIYLAMSVKRRQDGQYTQLRRRTRDVGPPCSLHTQLVDVKQPEVFFSFVLLQCSSEVTQDTKTGETQPPSQFTVSTITRYMDTDIHISWTLTY